MRLHSKEATEDAVQRDIFKLKQFPTVLKVSNTLHKVLEIDPGSRMMGNKLVRVWQVPQKPRAWMEVMKELTAGQEAARGGGHADEVVQSDGGDASVVRGSRGGLFGSFRGQQERGRPGQTPRRPLTRPMRNLVESPVLPAVKHRDIGLPDTYIAKTENGQPYETAIGSGVEKGQAQGEKRKLQDSPGFEPSHFTINLQQQNVTRSGEDIEWLPGIILTDCDEPLSSTVRIQSPIARRIPTPPPVKEPLFPPIPASAEPASPPFEHAKLLEQSRQDHFPIYWDWLLSKRLCEWLDDEASTTSTQTELTHIVLRSADNTIQPLRFEAKDFEKVKLTRLTISPEAATERSTNSAIQGAPEQRDWFVFEVQHKNIIVASMEMDEDGVPVDEPDQDPEDLPEDYWILALPVCAVTDSKSTSMDLGGGDDDDGGVLQTTVWTVGVEGFVPSMHGRAVEGRFAEAFVTGCGSAKGIVEFASIY